MRKLILIFAFGMFSQVFAQSKEVVNVNGVSYTASAINELQATCIQSFQF